MIQPKVIETIWKRDIPEETREKAVREAYRIANEGLASFEDKADIMAFCDWSRTPSGHNFWSAICSARNKRK